MKSIAYAFLTTFRPIIFLVCKLWSGFGVLALLITIVMSFVDKPAWAALAMILVFGCVLPQMILIFYNRLIGMTASQPVILSE